MAWELLAIWAIVGVAIAWFVRDERMQKKARLDAQARTYSADPQWRHQSADGKGALTAAQRAEIEILRRRFLRGLMADASLTHRS